MAVAEYHDLDDAPRAPAELSVDPARRRRAHGTATLAGLVVDVHALGRDTLMVRVLVVAGSEAAPAALSFAGARGALEPHSGPRARATGRDHGPAPRRRPSPREGEWASGRLVGFSEVTHSRSRRRNVPVIAMNGAPGFRGSAQNLDLVATL